MDIIAQRIKEQRSIKGWSQNELALRLGLTQDSISLWEKGKRLPDTPYIIMLSKIFDISADYLLGLEDEHGAKVQLYSNNHVDVKGDHNNVQIGNNRKG